MNVARIAEILSMLPESQHDLSGIALYSGLSAWIAPSPIYLMGVNPGGTPGEDDTVYAGAEAFLADPKFHDWSAYRDVIWLDHRGNARPAGTAPMQRRVLHLLAALDLNPAKVPATNLAFARSAQIAHVPQSRMGAWAEETWESFHAPMIERLQPKVVVAMGHDAGWFVRNKLDAHTLIETFTENNRRGWKSFTFSGPGPSVVSLTHPGRANWINPDTDPTGLAVRALAAALQRSGRDVLVARAKHAWPREPLNE